jgi:hypothetical protein
VLERRGDGAVPPFVAVAEVVWLEHAGSDGVAAAVAFTALLVDVDSHRGPPDLIRDGAVPSSC